MDAKLTLKLDREIIDKAKKYAAERNISLSRMIEAYLKFLTTKSTSTSEEITPLVKSLSGVIHDPKSDYKKTYRQHLRKKYS